MQRTPSNDKKSRPIPVNTTNHGKSFARYEPSSPTSAPSPQSITGSGTSIKGAAPQSPETAPAPSVPPERTHSDIFETQDGDDESPDVEDEATEESFPDGFDELPIEIQSLMER